MTLSLANTVLSIWIILVGIASIENSDSMSKDDLLRISNETKLFAETSKNQLQNDPKNKESNGTIAGQFESIIEQAELLEKLIKPMSLDLQDDIHHDNKFIIQSFYNQFKELRTLVGDEFDEFSHEASKQQKLMKEIEKQRNIAMDYKIHHKSKSISNQFRMFYSQLYGIEQTLINKHGEPSAISSVHAIKVLDVVETEVTQLTKQLKLLTEKYPKT